ncbi:hypothetical protein FOA52_015453 [Chlamydomonas sp. UWO 241]|nr:hypothetical protein FOA52_015453 [Chlamydomonas sp. UWO 241]
MVEYEASAVPVDQCLSYNVSYDDRYINTDSLTWCTVPDGSFDAVFFAAFGVIIACVSSTKWLTLTCLVAGGIYQGLSHAYNLKHVSNASSLWLNMEPPDVFMFIFLPPLLLQSSMQMDFFLLKKVAWNVLFLAIFLVVGGALLMIPFMLSGLGLTADGWTSADCLLFGIMIGATDAASVIAVLHGSGAPEILSVILDAESLFNDASSLVMFELIKEVVQEDEPFSAAVVGQIFKHIVIAAAGGAAIGISSGIFTQVCLRWMQWRKLPGVAEIALTLGVAYAAFFITQIYVASSGVIAVVVYGVYGSVTMLWGLSKQLIQAGTITGAYDIIVFVLNGIIFFFVGASATNLTIMTGMALNNGYEVAPTNSLSGFFKRLAANVAALYAFSFALRFVLTAIAFKVFQLLRLADGVSMRSIVFISAAGLRGFLALIFVQTVIQMEGYDPENVRTYVLTEIALWCTAYVVLTLTVNAPLLSPLLRWLRLNTKTAQQLRLEANVRSALRGHTETSLADARARALPDAMFSGVEWGAVARAADVWGEEQPGLLARAAAAAARAARRCLRGRPRGEGGGVGASAGGAKGAGEVAAEEGAALGGKGAEGARVDAEQQRVYAAYEAETSTVGRFEADANARHHAETAKPHAMLMGTHWDGTFLRAPSHVLRRQGTKLVKKGGDAVEEGAAAATGAWARATRALGLHVPRRTLDHGTGHLVWPWRRRGARGPRSARRGGSGAAAGSAAGATDGKSDGGVARASCEVSAPGDVVVELLGGGEGDEGLAQLRSLATAAVRQGARTRFLQGLMRQKSFDAINFACEVQLARLEVAEAEGHDDVRFDLWSILEAELAPSWLLRQLAHAHHALRTRLACARGAGARARGLRAAWLRTLLCALTWRLGDLTSMRLEAALQLWRLLGSGGMESWLGELDPTCVLLTEIKANIDSAWTFVVDRTVEAPEALVAIQSYCISIGLLAQAEAFVATCTESGLVQTEEAESLTMRVLRQRQALERSGPTLPPPGAFSDHVAGLLLLHGVDPAVLSDLRACSTLMVHAPGEQLWTDALHAGDTMLVVGGTLRAKLLLNGGLISFYLGPGRLLGLLAHSMAGAMEGVTEAEAHGEADALGRGPLLLTTPASEWTRIEGLAIGDGPHAPQYRQLVLQLRRAAAAGMVELLKGPVMRTFSVYVRQLVRLVLDEHRGALSMAEAATEAAEEEGRAGAGDDASQQGSRADRGGGVNGANGAGAAPTAGPYQGRAILGASRLTSLLSAGGVFDSSLPAELLALDEREAALVVPVAEAAAAPGESTLQHQARAFSGVEPGRLARLAASVARHVSHRCHGAHASLACSAASGELLTLQPGQAFVHDCAAVLVRGSLVAAKGGGRGRGAASGAAASADVSGDEQGGGAKQAGGGNGWGCGGSDGAGGGAAETAAAEDAAGARGGGGTEGAREGGGGWGGSSGAGQAVMRGVPCVAGLGGLAVEGRAPFSAPSLLAWSAASFPDLGHVQQGQEGGGGTCAEVLVAGPDGAQIIVA